MWLTRGTNRPNLRVCSVLEAVSLREGHRWSDRPRSVSPVLANYVRFWADGLDDENRQRLEVYVEPLIGTIGNWDTETERTQICMRWHADWLVPQMLVRVGITPKGGWRALEERVGAEKRALMNRRLKGEAPDRELLDLLNTTQYAISPLADEHPNRAAFAFAFVHGAWINLYGAQPTSHEVMNELLAVTNATRLKHRPSRPEQAVSGNANNAEETTG